MTNTSVIESSVREFLASSFGFRGATADMDGKQDLLAGGILDSTAVLEVVAFVENDLGVRVEDQEMIPENLGSILNIVAFVERKRRAIS